MITAPHKPAHLRRTVALAGALAALAITSVSLAAPRSDSAPSVTVHYGDLDLSTAAGVDILYRRIAGAARQVCPGVYSRDLSTVIAANRCQAEAIANAVQRLDNPRLALVHASHTSHVSRTSHG